MFWNTQEAGWREGLVAARSHSDTLAYSHSPVLSSAFEGNEVKLAHSFTQSTILTGQPVFASGLGELPRSVGQDSPLCVALTV
jgi:hypothetical protein